MVNQILKITFLLIKIVKIEVAIANILPTLTMHFYHQVPVIHKGGLNMVSMEGFSNLKLINIKEIVIEIRFLALKLPKHR